MIGRAGRVLPLGLGIAFGVLSAGCFRHAPKHPNAAGAGFASARMPDGKVWMTENLSVTTSDSYCYRDAEQNCGRYGRLYTWESAQRACRSLGNGWRLPTNDEWQRLAKHYGGVVDDSNDGGKAAFAALVTGGASGFNVVFGGGRRPDGEYARLDAHGFYWTASETDASRAWLYNFGQAKFLNRHRDGEKVRALSVRCVRDGGTAP
jgi:uncharacterized protein (TIGR02145 family)